jgi:hypothetical protein
MEAKLLADIADRYWETREKRLAADKAAAALKLDENKDLAILLAEMRSLELTAIGGNRVKLTLVKKEEPIVTNWPAFYDYILETKDFSLLTKHIGKAAIKERWDAGATVPGAEKFPVYTLSKSEVK